MKKKCVGLLAPCVLLLGGCFGSSPNVHYFALSSLERGEASQVGTVSGKNVIAVAPVSIPEYLNRSGIVRLKGPNEIDVSEIELWVEPLSDAITRNVVENLSVTCGSEKRSFQPMSESGSSDAKLVIDIERFEKSGDQVLLRARWTIRVHGDMERAPQRLTIYNEQLASSGTSAEIQGLSLLLQKFAGEICKEVQGA